MIAPEQVFLAVEPVDMRWSMGRLSVLIQQSIGRSPCDGTASGFINRSHTRLKLLVWDGTGVWLCHRRLHRGRLYWPRQEDILYRMSAEQWRRTLKLSRLNGWPVRTPVNASRRTTRHATHDSGIA